MYGGPGPYITHVTKCSHRWYKDFITGSAKKWGPDVTRIFLYRLGTVYSPLKFLYSPATSGPQFTPQNANSCPRTSYLFIFLSLLHSTWINWLYSMRSFYGPYVPLPRMDVPCSVPAENILSVSHNQIVPCGKRSVCFTHPSRCSLFLSLGKYTSNLFCSDPLDVPCSIPLYYSPIWMFPIPSPRKMFCFFHSPLWMSPVPFLRTMFCLFYSPLRLFPIHSLTTMFCLFPSP